MTRNEKITKQIGWRKDEHYGWHKPDGGYWNGEELNFSKSWHLSKLLQAKMVADGWTVDMRAFRNGCFEFSAILPHSLSPNSECQFHKSEAATEPDAIVELFCKVYNIGGER